MADKEYKIKIKTEVDKKDVHDLKTELKNLNNTNINVNTTVDDSEIKNTQAEISNLEDETVIVEMETDTGDIRYFKKELEQLPSQTAVYIECDVDGKPVENARRQIRSLKDENIIIRYMSEGENEAFSKAQEMRNLQVNIPIGVDGEEQIDEVNNKIKTINGKTLNNTLNINDSKIKEIESEIKSLEQEKLNLEVNAPSDKLNEINNKIKSLKQQKANLKLDVDDSKIKTAQSKIESLNEKEIIVDINPDTNEITTAKVKIDELNSNADVTINVDGEEQIDQVDEKVSNLNGKTATGQFHLEGDEEIDAANEKMSNLNGKTATGQFQLEGDEQIDSASDRIDGLSNKLTGLVGGIGMVDQATKMWNASTSRQFQSFYLGANIGTQEAQKMQREIQGIVASVPGDDTFMNQLMTTALAQNTQLTTDNLKQLANVSADYMAGSKMMGKMNLESQQDIYKYLLDGNTAELERGSIVSSQIDKLKDKATIEERILAMNEALNSMGYEGISGYDTASNNMEEFMGNLEKSRADMGDLFLPLEQGALKSALAINEQTGGALTGLIVAGEMIVPTAVTGLSAIGEMSRGISALRGGWNSLKERISSVKDTLMGLGGKWNSVKNTLASGINSVRGTLNTLKSTAVSVASTLKTNLVGAYSSIVSFMRTSLIPTLKSAATSLLTVGKNALISGYNALRSGAMWLINKTRIVATTIANWGATASQWALNIAMSMNPITLVVLAIVGLIAVLGYLYFNNEQVRQAVDGLGQSLYNIGTIIYGYLTQAWNTIISTLQGVWNYIVTLGGLLPANVNMTGNQILNTIIRVMAFIFTLPLQIGMVFTNIIAKALGFGNNFAQRMIQGAINMVNGFINKIRELPGMIQEEFNRIAGIVSDFVTSLPQRVWDLGANIVLALKNALGIGSPGFMYYMFEGELNRLKDAPIDLGYGITKNVSKLGKDITNEFKPELETQNVSILTGMNTTSNDTPSQINNFYFEDIVVDDEQRMERICDYIVKRITWNNTTAGRTI